MKNKLMKKEGNVIRILEEKDDKVFIIDCIKKTMPYWCNLSSLSDFEICCEEFEVSREDLSAAEKRMTKRTSDGYKQVFYTKNILKEQRSP